MKPTQKIKQIMQERFGHDTLLSVATVADGIPYVRIVNSYYEDGAFYTVTYAMTNKMKQIEKNPTVAVCGEWFTAHGTAENLGWVKEENNAEIMIKLHAVFAEWYGNGHTDEEDKNTCILKITLTDATLANNGIWYEIDFKE